MPSEKSRGNLLKGIFLLALGYALLGRVALLLAIPPGYATAIFPSAGIAVAALLLWGYRIWPGILLGSAALNLWVSAEFTSTGIIVALSVSLGATLQSLVGARLVKRFVGFPSTLGKERDISRFMILAGPLACLVNASVGASSLLVTGLIQQQDYMFSWFTWWVGDTIGVMIAAPLMFILFAEPRELWWRRRISVATPLLLLLIAAISLFIWASHWEYERIQLEFKDAAKDSVEKLRSRFENYIEAVKSVERLYASSSNVTREEFHVFVKYIAQMPGMQGISWNEVVTRAGRDAFETRNRNEGFPDFRIRERDSTGKLVPAAVRESYVVVTYIEPMKGNKPALGYDVASSANRGIALNRARDLGKEIATEPVSLVQESGSQPGFLLFYPVYRGPTHTLQERRRNLIGFTVGVFRVADIIEEVSTDQTREQITIGLYDDTFLSNQNLYGPERNDLSDVPYYWTTTFNIGSRDWLISIKPTKAYLAAHRGWQAWAMLAMGLTFIALLSIFLLGMSGHSYQIEQIVEERTAALEYSNKELEAYSYSIAHDLRAPLRSIIGFSQVLLEDGKDSLDRNNVDHLQRIIASSKFMAKLIDDILDLSRVSRSRMEFTEVNLSKLCQQIIEELQNAEPDRKVSYQIQSNLLVNGDQRLLYLVLSNLLGNAWKFTQQNKEAHIEIGQSMENGQRVFYVRDNGIGFEMQYSSRIFGLFKRLHRKEEYAGTGVGLATVQRIIDRHEGWLRAEGEKGKGATIFFSLPEAKGKAA